MEHIQEWFEDIEGAAQDIRIKIEDKDYTKDDITDAIKEIQESLDRIKQEPI